MQAVCKWIKTIQQRIVFLVHAIKKMKRESVLWQLCQPVIDFHLFFLHLFYSFTVFEFRLSNLLSCENHFLKEQSWLSNSGLKWETSAWLFANTSLSVEMMLLSSWKYSVHCSSIAIRMCHGGCPVCSIFALLLLPAWFNNFKCINDNQDFILIHMSVQCFYQ